MPTPRPVFNSVEKCAVTMLDDNSHPPWSKLEGSQEDLTFSCVSLTVNIAYARTSRYIFSKLSFGGFIQQPFNQ